jgi:hypothetical protein
VGGDFGRFKRGFDGGAGADIFQDNGQRYQEFIFYRQHGRDFMLPTDARRNDAPNNVQSRTSMQSPTMPSRIPAGILSTY